MKPHRLFLPLLAAALAACNADAPRDTAAPVTPPADEASRAADPPAGVQASTPQPAPVPVDDPRLDGYGPLRFGMTEAEMHAAWGGALRDDGSGGACHYLQPENAQPLAWLAFMVEGGRFVRYDVGNDQLVAPGGGKVGMDAEGIRALYPGRVTTSPHKYVEGGAYLRIPAAHGDGVLVFETDAGGRVTSWRAGVAPQVDYIEGCA